jgi:hypothetical protein
MSQVKAQVNKLLTNVSNGLFPKGYIADLVLPELSVKQKTGLIGKYGANHLRVSDDLIGGRAEARRADPIIRSSDNYQVETHALEGVVTQDDYDNVEDPFSAESDEVLGLTHLILTNKEKQAADLLFNTGVITQNSTPGTKYDNYTSSDPLSGFRIAHNAVLDGSGVPANAAIMSRKVYNTLMFHPQLMDVLGFKYNQMGKLEQADLQKALGVDELLVADAPINNAKEGQNDSIAQLWANSILFYVKPQAAAKYQVSLGYKVTMASGKGRQVYKYALNNPPNANGIIVQDSYQFKLVNVGAAYLLNAVLT